MNTITIEEIRNVFKIMFKDTTYDFHNNEDLDRVFDFFIPFLSDSTLREVLVEGEELLKETYVLEDGVPVETYGYEETYNNGVNDVLKLLTKHLEK